MDVHSFIDHTLLAPTATEEQIAMLCQEALRYRFHCVCVNGCYTKMAREYLLHSDVKVCTVIGFPLGQMATKAKAMEAALAVDDGAEEIDMVLNIGWFRDGKDREVIADIRAVKDAIGPGIVLKVILETGLLTQEEIERACHLAVEGGADFVKTSTGFLGSGATVAAVETMKKTVQGRAKVKASGGIRDYSTAKSMVEAGADRLGTSASVHIVASARR